MSPHSQRERRLQAAEEAATWLLTLQSDEVSDAERAEFIDWLRESPLHVAELLHACRLQRDLATFRKWHEIATQDQRAARVVSLPPMANKRRRGRVTAIARLLGRRPLIAAICIAAIAGLSAAVAFRLGQTVISTQWGERREVTLVDGSVVDLAPNSAVRVRLRADERLVWLDRGEALFHVAKNSRRPFIVTAENTRVRAVGTAFDVQRRAGGVAVTVVEGRVSVTTEASPKFKSPALASVPRKALTPVPLSLSADEQVVISLSTGDATSIKQVEGEAEVAWVTNQLNFANESVAEVASRFNHYNRVQIRVLDQMLAARRVSGSFRVTDPESFVAFIKSVAGATVMRKGADVILLDVPSAEPGATTQH